MTNEKKQQLFEEVYEQFTKAIYRYIYFKVSDYELAYDLTADTFLRFWKAVAQGKHIKSNKTFLYFIAHGQVVDHYRKKKNKGNISIDSVDERLLTTQENFEEALAVKQEIDSVYSKLKLIKKEYREVILLYYVDELEVHEIAEIIKKKENAVRVLIHRAMQALKNKL